MQDAIPEEVLEAIQNHIRIRTAHAERGWQSGMDDEDTLTGDFGSSLRTSDWVEIIHNGERWRWRITYKKVRGKGGNAPETRIGADGIFQIEVSPNGGIVIYKGVLFQAKKYKGSSRSDLVSQVERMEQIAPGGSAVFEFGPDGYRGSPGRIIVEEREQNPRRIPHPTEPLSDYLADKFLPCQEGLRGMYYDFAEETLLVPGERVMRRVALKHLIEVDVQKRTRAASTTRRNSST